MITYYHNTSDSGLLLTFVLTYISLQHDLYVVQVGHVYIEGNVDISEAQQTDALHF